MTVPASISPAAAPADWMFLGVRMTRVTPPGAPVTVIRAELPVGAAPPLHRHRNLDDSFYVLAGRMVVRCGDDVSTATAGTWVPFPSGVPHTFRVLDGPAHVLLVHTNDSFLRAVQGIGRPFRPGDVTTTESGPDAATLTTLLAAHGMVTVGDAMGEEEARNSDTGT